MARNVHSLGPTCAYYEEDTDDVPTDASHPPKVKAQFFYVSSLPIDDPLSPLPPVSADKTTRLPPQPFSVRDNAALEEAWQSFQESEVVSECDKNARARRNFARGVFSFPEFRKTAAASGNKSPVGQSPSIANKGTGPPEEADVMLDPDSGAGSGPKPVDEQELNEDRDLRDQPAKHKRRFSPFRHRHKAEERDRDDSPNPVQTNDSRENSSRPNTSSNSNISGRPFARPPSGRDISSASAYGGSWPPLDESDLDSSKGRSRTHSSGRDGRKEAQQKKLFVPVGVSRLHLVELPDLIMKPIYWSPINDTSDVIRATWFYKDTMLPVPADVANRLEIGYEYMKPYAESYQEELQACIENGASAEMKVVYKLWPDEPRLSRPGSAADTKEMDQPLSQESVTEPLPERSVNAAADPRKKPKEKRLFATHSVIYTDAKNAQILRPSLLPSDSKNRRPLSSLRKGRQIGVAVVRGFDRKAWLKIHPDPKLDAKAAYAKVGAYMSQSGDATTRGQCTSCAACEQETETPRVSDLVLVIHGIGQKLSERVDSFHFTHAVNGLRREFNVELSTEAVKGNLRPGTGIMVLPVNWRLTVSFDEGDKASQEDAENIYALKDITPDTLPGVRSLISDVMLDIPYYLSHHKDKMTSAVIREANRVFRLWCRNNPGFEDYGRVHLIAHSLGSVMAMEILSQQPTRIGKDMRFDSKKPSEKMFEFDTANLFCCGSPSGFFLLLNNASLVPRKGRNKPGMEGEDRQPGIASEAKYGCLAVDNLYNICHRNDPISYLQNAAVDQLYAASLQPASIPSASISLMRRLGHTLRWTSPSTSDPYTSGAVPATRPELQQLPSTVELETHNFTREEIAEKRMYLLNDNGQIDWFLNSGGGPLEIQYLSMLSAHSSYWILQDFVRFLVVEIGREPGRAHTLPVLRAVKKREYKKGNIA
ncbi:phospholipase [Exophiala dermatitidis]